MIASEIREFVAIVEHGSVSEAARQLDVPRATLSRRLGALEDELGVTLLHRETRRLALTQAGEELYRKALKIVADIEEAEVAVRALDGVPRGLLRISIPPAMGDQAAGFIAEFLERYPEVTLDIITSNRHVDLVGEGIDAALRGGMVRDPGLMARRLMSSRLVLVAAPKLLEEVGPIETIEDLDRLPCVGSFEGGWRPINEYPTYDGGTVTVSGPVRSNDMALSRQLVLRGTAASLVPEEFIHSELASGRLVQVLPGIVGTDGALSIVWPQQDYMDPKVRAFIDTMAELFKGWRPRDWEL